MRSAATLFPGFDPTASFIALRPITLLGKQLKGGDPIPKGIGPHRLRQLVDARRIAVAPANPVKVEKDDQPQGGKPEADKPKDDKPPKPGDSKPASADKEKSEKDKAANKDKPK